MNSFKPITIKGSVVAITGGARGIGLATARRFAAAGARVAIGDLDLAAAQDSARTLGIDATGYQVDVGDRESFAAFIDRVESEVGPIDVMVNNAGIMPVGALLDGTEAVAQATMSANFWAHYHALRTVAPRMVHRGRGHIINVTSAAGKVHSPGLAIYVASKHAATGLSRSAREELLGTGVSVTAVLPSAVRTQLLDGIPFRWWERLAIVSPDRIARVITGTLRRRPALVGAPRGLIPLLNAAAFVPEFLWMWGRRVSDADRVMGPIDREQRAEYDSRIDGQTIELVQDPGSDTAPARQAISQGQTS
ncbi:NADP-dependent 3-hydroxy acid dehydrogenase YdfG [Nocardia farcinica]|uniref:3-oxoacyl-[acyl-carrier-protein] reductase FabG n=1 Tax=Nocardia farcinica TaxID=37329 RepID=A0A0H5NPU2_NOCFR|nr:SDR family NAD(P)-dependent oxidoreductase [Nocardia farcinica]AXK85857.1 SDR family NAD(P)-dependent oxidoreductase [Nocardia farcinica]MBA4859205.1 SDR family NAD(P)-dependent oxidoreductase [Nocardia farcinica]MBC9819013.1 SDR family NAD(P)-dependent oxidoreductase [Nocardia farcinica]PFW98755.1 putative oxidoreductase [Nocardia farcinica]PFX04376.1 putative oxidoreductase [Nocardia farcinica]